MAVWLLEREQRRQLRARYRLSQAWCKRVREGERQDAGRLDRGG
jgi:hypothetical protein